MLNRNLKWLLILLFPFISGCAVLVAAGVVSGVGAGAAVSQDRRTSGMFVEDEGIEFKSGRRISEKMGGDVNVNVTSFNRNVLLTGEAPTEGLKKEIGKLVTGVQNVRKVTNEIAIGDVSSFASRSNDALLTSKVKARFLDSGEFQVNHVKVVTEDAVVYLLGLVKVREGDSAVNIARSTSGVRKVVKVFEYLD
ncbi:Osmotically-inducible protein OsmY, contains BON domain [Nitrosospira sp. Nsp11]|jgi:osmotically-inducible protein OsmY|uniref:BON domain-containing protein n=1 Tax=Nitrosospira sp. Nsp11 TaxID=1855338 RepID=UPI0009115C49|nr:BON domain-containing protein [Nitrosospira sp. Nsp11]SHL87072.1 Osmotically-inducible protein OsmY, contains BON domain [Nitrosospira sp. Nsp11]